MFSGNVNLVRDVMVGGTWVVRDGRHLKSDEIAEAYRAVVGEADLIEAPSARDAVAMTPAPALRCCGLRPSIARAWRGA